MNGVQMKEANMDNLVEPKNPVDSKVLEFQREFDNALDNQDVAELRKTIDEVVHVLATINLNSISIASSHYLIATAYANLEAYAKDYQNEDTQEKIIFYYRKSIDSIHGCETADINNPHSLGLQLNLYTNYANALNRIGKTIEAIEYYQRALAINPKFGMALGNCGIAYITYANIMYDLGHRNILHYFAFRYLSTALVYKNNLHPEAIQCFSDYLSSYDESFKEEFLEKKLELVTYSLGEAEYEIDYRTWVLREHLYLNPMNELYITESFIATDSLQLPSMSMKVIDGLNYKFHSMFNYLKQEYISARFNFFECTKLVKEIHFADRGTHLIDTLDYTSFSIRLEKLKLSYRSLYSLFDKTAYFLNEYFGLGIRERDITFRSIWRSRKDGKNGYTYKCTLPYKNNYALNAIYWLFKDLSVKLQSATNPYAEKYSMLRNALEHKFVNVYLNGFYDEQNKDAQDSSFDISEETLEKYTLQLMKMVRELLIYLSLSVHINEQQRMIDKDEFCPPINTYKLDDEWKL